MSGYVTINKKYVSRKIKSVRWKPPNSYSENAKIFVSGSWDDEENNLSVWHLNEVEGDPTLLQEIPQSQNITDIQYVTRDLFAIGTGNGCISLYQHNSSNLVDCKQSWEKCHCLKTGSVSCTALASNGEQVASVGEDGKLIILNPHQQQPIKVIESESGCSDYAVIFVKAAEVLTANMQGHLKLWDLRAQNSCKATLLSPDQISVNHLANHPTQQHLVAAGGEDGTVALWDMRSISQPLALISAHNGSISEVQFHPSASDHMFTCGVDGKILHWNATAASRTLITPSSKSIKESLGQDKSGLPNAWFTSDVARGSVDTTSLIPTSQLPINSLNIESETLIAGSDNEAIYIIKNVLLLK